MEGLKTGCFLFFVEKKNSRHMENKNTTIFIPWVAGRREGHPVPPALSLTAATPPPSAMAGHGLPWPAMVMACMAGLHYPTILG